VVDAEGLFRAGHGHRDRFRQVRGLGKFREFVQLRKVGQLVVGTQLVQGLGKVLQVGGRELAGVDLGEEGGLGFRRGLRQDGTQVRVGRFQGQLQGPPVQGGQLVEPRPADLTQEQGEGPEAEGLDPRFPAQFEEGPAPVQEGGKPPEVRRQGQLLEAATLQHHHLVQGTELLQDGFAAPEVQHPRQQHQGGVEGQADRGGVQLTGLEGGGVLVIGHGRPDHPLHLGPGHVQEIPLGDEAHLDEVLADGHAGVEVGQGVVQLGLGDAPAFHQQVGETIQRMRAAREDDVAMLQEDGPLGVLAQPPEAGGLLAVVGEQILEGG